MKALLLLFITALSVSAKGQEKFEFSKSNSLNHFTATEVIEVPGKSEQDIKRAYTDEILTYANETKKSFEVSKLHITLIEYERWERRGFKFKGYKVQGKMNVYIKAGKYKLEMTDLLYTDDISQESGWSKLEQIDIQNSKKENWDGTRDEIFRGFRQLALKKIKEVEQKLSATNF